MSSGDPLGRSPLSAATTTDSNGDPLDIPSPTLSTPSSRPTPLSSSVPTSTFFTPPRVQSSSNGHSSSARPPLFPLSSASKTHGPPSSAVKPLALVKVATAPIAVDPLLHPLQHKEDDNEDFLSSGGSGGTSSPAPKRLSSSLSSSELSSAAVASPSTSPAGVLSPLAASVSAQSNSASTVASAASVPSSPAIPPALSPTSPSQPLPPAPSVQTPSSTPHLPPSTSSSSLSHWFSSLGSSSSSSRDVALISTPSELFPNYFNELSAFLHTLQQHPIPNPPPSIALLQEKLPPQYVPPPQSALSSAQSDLDSRRKQSHLYASSTVKKKAARLSKQVTLNEQYVLELKLAIVRARKKCDSGYEGLQAVVERLRSWYLMNEFNLLQEGMHLQDELFDAYEDMAKAAILLVKDRNAQLQRSIDALLKDPSASPALNEFHFLSAKQLCMLNPDLPDMLQRQSDLATRLAQVKVEYVAVSKATEEEEKYPRPERITRVIADFYASYKGDLTADYSPARALEYEFARFCLDERTKEGAMLKKWMESITAQATAQADSKGGDGKEKAEKPLTHHSILVWMRKFESNFAKEYVVDAAHRLYLRLLIQRMLFPRIWSVCCLVEDCLGESREKDEVYVSQCEWLRCVQLEQLGVTAPFLMPDSIKQAVVQKMSAGSSRWSKANAAAQQLHDDEKGVGGGQLPTELPSALKDLLHLSQADQDAKDGSAAAVDTAAKAAVLAEGNDDFERLFVKGSRAGGGSADVGAGGNLFDRFDKTDDLKTDSTPSPNVSPSPLKPSPLVASNTAPVTSTLSLTQPTSTTSDALPPAAPTSSARVSSAAPAPAPPSLPSSSFAATAPLHATPASHDSKAPMQVRIAALRQRCAPIPGRLRPYLSCIDCLEDISHLTSPLDMLQCLLAVARNLYKTATEYSALNAGGTGKKAELGADSFFPIWTYVLIQSDVKDLHRRMRIMKEYGVVKTQELAEHEYYLTCMEGALVFVREADPDKY